MNIAKGIGICLIVLGHSFSEESNSTIRSFVYLFHVPFFFIISGYFFKKQYIDNPARLLVSRIKSLWVPFFYWSVFFILFHNFLFTIFVYSQDVSFSGSSIQIYSFLDISEKLIKLFFFKGSEQLLGAFWFLPCLFFTIIIFLIVNLFSKKINSKYIVVALSSLLFFCGNLLFFLDVKIPVISYDIRLYCITTFLYYIGFCYKKYENFVPMKFGLAAFSFLILLFVNELNFIKIDSIYSTVGSLRYSILYLVVTPILGTYCILYMSKLFQDNKKFKFFQKIGRLTIVILALHFLCFKFVSFVIVYLENLNINHIALFPVIPNHEEWFFAYTIAGICIPVAIHYLFINTRDSFMQLFSSKKKPKKNITY